MIKKNQNNESDRTSDLVMKLLILELAKFGLPQGEIAKKLCVNIVVVNDFLKGIKLK